MPQNAQWYLKFSGVQVNKYSKHKILRLTFIFFIVSSKLNAISHEILYRYTSTTTLSLNF